MDVIEIPEIHEHCWSTLSNRLQSLSFTNRVEQKLIVEDHAASDAYFVHQNDENEIIYSNQKHVRDPSE